MGVLTSFILVEPEFAKFGSDEIKDGPLEWMIFESSRPEEFGLPAGYKTRRCGIDKSWDEWSDVLRAMDYGEVRDTLFSFPSEIDDPWGMWTRYLPVSFSDDPNAEDDVQYIRSWLWPFDADAAKKKALNAKITDYDGEEMNETGVGYVVHHMEAFAKWLHESYKDGDFLVITSS